MMAGWRRAVDLAMTDEEIEALAALSRSRTESASWVSRAQMLLAYRETPSFFAVGQRLGVHHQTVQRCVERALAYGALAALDDRPRPGKEPVITAEAKAWLVSLACDKAKEHGYAHELWTTRLLARHARERGAARLPRPSGSGHGVQDPRPRGNQAAQSAVLSGASRCRVRAENGGGSVRLSPGSGPEKSCRQVEQAGEAGRYRLLRRKAGNPGHRHDGGGFAPRTGRPCHIRPRSRVQAPRHAQPVGRHRSAHRKGPCPGQGSPPQPRVCRIPQAARDR